MLAVCCTTRKLKVPNVKLITLSAPTQVTPTFYALLNLRPSIQIGRPPYLSSGIAATLAALDLLMLNLWTFAVHACRFPER